MAVRVAGMKERLEDIIHKSQATAAQTVERVMSQVPVDTIVRATALKFTYDGQEAGGLTTAGPLVMRGGEQEWRLHRHGLRQVAEKADVPLAYVDTLYNGQPWQRSLLRILFNETFQHKEERYLVRAVGQPLEARGVLSDRYRRLDSRPLLDAFIGAVRQYGAVPYGGVATDTRVAVKAILPEVFQPMPGEFVGQGVEWSNSDFGAARLSVRAFILRIICINGATAEDLLSQVHLGGRLPEDIHFSRRTYELDTRTMTSAMGDVVKHALGPGGPERLMNRIAVANEKEVRWENLRGRLEKALTKDEVKKVGDAFNGPDVENLPPGNTAWRASNALSWVGRTIEDPERRLDFERIAGSVLTKNGQEAA